MTDLCDILPVLPERYAQALRHTAQSPVYHAEGDAYTHTMMVCNALVGLREYGEITPRRQQILRIAAMLHDIGKTRTTKFVDGDWHTPHHAPVGSRMARELLWREHGLGGDRTLTEEREAICLLVRYHSFPAIALEHSNPRLMVHRIAANGLLAPDFSIRLLCVLARADILGRECHDRQELLDKIALCEELAHDEGCLDSPFPFPSAHTRRAFLAGQDVWPGQELYDDRWGEVVLMSGLPGTGKDTWIKRNLPGMSVVSLDGIRRANKVPPTADQGRVAGMAREMAREHLRAHRPFVWNATNITAQMRESLVALFESYRAHVRIVYLETGWPTLLERNRSRDDAVPEAVVERMTGKLSPPEAHEARAVEWWPV